MASKNELEEIVLQELEEIVLQEADGENYLSVYPETNYGVEVNIAIVGAIGSGRSSFVNAITGVKEDDENAAKPGERSDPTSKIKQFSCYSPPEKQNIRFWILPSIDEIFYSDSYFESLKFDMYDVFLFFVSVSCNEQLLKLAKEIKNRSKPVFFVQISQEANVPWHKLKLKETGSLKVYRIDSCQLNEHEFYKLSMAIVDVLPSRKKECFEQIPIVWELVALNVFKNFVEEQAVKAKEGFLSRSDLEESIKSRGIMGMRLVMKESLKQWKKSEINLAILGDSGAGKSSFINAIRGLKSSDRLGAKTGLTETTKVPSPYEHPTNPNIRFWDLPGVGTPSHPEVAKFCEEMAIEAFDTFLIIASKRFTEFHRQFAEIVTSMGKPFFFVRSMFDQAIEGEKHDYGDNFDEEKAMEKVRKDCVEGLKGTKFSEENIFLISNHYPNKWDFHRLTKAIFDKLPSDLKDSFIFSLRPDTGEILKDKIQTLKKRTWMVAITSVLIKTTLGPLSFTFDAKRIKKRVKFYCSQLRFPEIGSSEFKELSEDLQKEVEKFHLKPDQNMAEWIKSFDDTNEYNIRIYGPFIRTNQPHNFVNLFLNLVLEKMEKTANAILFGADAK